MNEIKPKSIGPLGEARAENARLKRENEAARSLVDEVEWLLDMLEEGLGEEQWMVVRGRTVMHRNGLARLQRAIWKYRSKFTGDQLSPAKRAVIDQALDKTDKGWEVLGKEEGDVEC
jgi:hypothetical protein